MPSYNHRDYLNDDAFGDCEEPLAELSQTESPLVAPTRLSPEGDASSSLLDRSELRLDRYRSASLELKHPGVSPRYDAFLPKLSSWSRSPTPDSPPYDEPWMPSDAPRYDPPTSISPQLLYSDSFSSSEEDSSRPSTPEARGPDLRPRQLLASRYNSAQDSDPESGDSGSEYNPSDSEDSDTPRSRHHERSRARRHTATRKHRSYSSSPSSSSSSSSHRLSQRHHPYSVDSLSSGLLARSKQINKIELEEPKDFVCPYCRHYQRNHRRPDLRRHMNTHTQNTSTLCRGRAWFCCGVPVELADQYGVEDVKSAKTWSETGKVQMVGGCGRNFSRKDAYHRHLRANKDCVGDPNGEWVNGNQLQRKNLIRRGD